MCPECLAIVEFRLKFCNFLSCRQSQIHQLHNFHEVLIFIFLLINISFQLVEFFQNVRSTAGLVDKFILHQILLELLNVSVDWCDFSIDVAGHLGFFALNQGLGLDELILQLGILVLDVLQICAVLSIHTTLKSLKLSLHILNLVLLQLQIPVVIPHWPVMLNVLSVILYDCWLCVENDEVVSQGSLDILNLLDHQGFQLLFVRV